jgi:hypothetical protein
MFPNLSQIARYFRIPLRKLRSRPFRIAEAAVAILRLPWKEAKPGVWMIASPRRHGFRVRLTVFVRDQSLVCMARAGIKVNRPWIPQRLSVMLLEQNSRYFYGSNSLIDTPEGMAIVHCHVCDTTKSDAEEVANVCRVVMRQMQDLVTRLYAEELVIHTPTGSRVLELG